MPDDTSHSGLQLYLDQLSKVIEAQLSIPALFMSLPLPEALGRLEFKERNATRVFAKWWDKYMPDIYKERFPGQCAWRFRNDIIHNFGGTDDKNPNNDLALSFRELSPVEFHFVDLVTGAKELKVISALGLAEDIKEAAAGWLRMPPSGYDSQRMNRMLKINFNLLEPLGSGLPLITLRRHLGGECTQLSVRS